MACVASDFYASPFGAVYSAYMERPALARRISRLVWGGRLDLYYASMAAVGEVPEGGVIVDCPCGAGPVPKLAPIGAGTRYVAVDLSPAMLARARRRASDRALEDAEFICAEAASIPLPADSADLFLSYWGLHCFGDPEAALREAARIVAPGGRFVGATFVRGTDSRRQRALIRPGLGDFGSVATAVEIDGGIERAGFVDVAFERSGPMLFFDGRIPD